MKYDIHHRWTGNVIVTAEIDCDESASASVKLGLAVRWAVKVRADLTDANLARANLAGACLWGTSGNMVEVRSMQVDLWAVTWTTSFDGEVIVQIGCQRHPLRLWEKSDPRWIAAMDGRATEWWAKWREPLLAIVKANPAVPFGQAVRPKERGETPEEVGQ